MSKITYGLVTGIFLLCSCKEGKWRSGGDFRTLTMELTVPLNENEQTPRCSISLQIDSLNDTTQVARKINETIARQAFGNPMASISLAADSFCKARIRHYRESYSELYRTDKRFGVNSSWYNHHYTVQAEHAEGHNGTICFRITAAWYEGGVREVEDIRYVNLSRKTGDIVTLDNLLMPDYETFLPSMLQSALLDKFKCKDLQELHAQGILRHSTTYIPKNYEIGSDGITFLYNADEIAPYETGSIALHLSYSQLNSLLKTE